MKKSTKIWLIIALVLIVSGWMIGFLCLKSVGYDWNAFRLNDRMIEKSQGIDPEFLDLDIEIHSADLKIMATDDAAASITTKLENGTTFSCNVENGELIIRSEPDVNKEWFERMWCTEEESITLYLPNKVYGSLCIQNQSADIVMQDQLTWNEAQIETVSGDIETHANVLQSTVLNTTSGNAQLSGNYGNLSVTTNSGDVSCQTCTCGPLSVLTNSGEISLNKCTSDNIVIISDSGDLFLMNTNSKDGIRVSAKSADVFVSYCSAGSMKIDTFSGDVLGVTDQDWKYTVQTSSGSVLTPQSAGDRPCIVTTNSGDVEFQKTENREK